MYKKFSTPTKDDISPFIAIFVKIENSQRIWISPKSNVCCA